MSGFEGDFMLKIFCKAAFCVTAPQIAAQSLLQSGFTKTGLTTSPKVGDGNLAHVDAHPPGQYVLTTSPKVGDGNLKDTFMAALCGTEL